MRIKGIVYKYLNKLSYLTYLISVNTHAHTHIPQNPDGSLSQAAMMQTALSKERREIKQIQRESDTDGTPVGLQKSWIDPMPSGSVWGVGVVMIMGGGGSSCIGHGSNEYISNILFQMM